MVCEVLVEVNSFNTDKLFDYKVPSSMESKIKIGIRVEVPFGNRTINGFIMNIKDIPQIIEIFKSYWGTNGLYKNEIFEKIIKQKISYVYRIKIYY